MGMSSKEFDEQTGRFRVESDPDGSGCSYLLRDTKTGKVIGRDGGEPEDQLLVRNWQWVRTALNTLDEESIHLRVSVRRFSRFYALLNQMIPAADDGVRTDDEVIARFAEQIEAWQRSAAGATTPIPMILNCPQCTGRHVDAGVFATKAHHTHACQSCGFCWRPSIVPTVGVQFLPGFKDEPEAGEQCPDNPAIAELVGAR